MYSMTRKYKSGVSLISKEGKKREGDKGERER